MSKGDHSMNISTKAAIVLLPILISSGCITTPAYQSTQPHCLQRANASCIAALREGYDSGVIIYLPREAQGVYHAVIWVDHRKGDKPSGKRNIKYYDPTRKMYLAGISGPVTWVSRGPSLAWWAAEDSEAADIRALVASK